MELDEPATAQAFTDRGAIPPVASSSPTERDQPPSPSELAFGSEKKEPGGAPATPAPSDATAPASRPTHPAPVHSEVQRTAGFEQLARSHTREAGAPSEVELPSSLGTAMDQAWRDSLSGPTEQEQGGNVVRTYGGDYKLRRGNDHDGSTFTPDAADVGATQTLVGIAHTHPYRDEGYEFGTFSGQDLANMVNEDQPLKLLRSGPFTYMVSRTKEFDTLVAGYEQRGTSFELYQKMVELFDRTFDAHRGAMPDRLEAATIAVCNAFHLIYYEGEGRDLHRMKGP